MFGSSLTAQGVGNAIGAQKGINLEEAAEAALFAAGLTFGFIFVKSSSVYILLPIFG